MEQKTTLSDRVEPQRAGGREGKVQLLRYGAPSASTPVSAGQQTSGDSKVDWHGLGLLQEAESLPVELRLDIEVIFAGAVEMGIARG